MEDFSSLLNMAAGKQVEKANAKSRYLCTKIAAAKKTPKEKKLSENIARFVAKQKEDEKKKKQGDLKRTRELLAMRSTDSKSTRVMNSMLKRTKSANKAVIAEARNVNDTAHTLAGREQCDEDDYGYESVAAGGFYEKLMKGYESRPQEDPMAKFSKSDKKSSKDMSGTVARVKERLDKGYDADGEVCTKEKRERTRTSSSSVKKERESTSKKRRWEPGDDDDEAAKKKKKVYMSNDEARRKRQQQQKMPPPPSFNDLMSIAQQKHKEPIKVDKKKLVKESEFGRPMTSKEKEEFLRERISKLRKAGKLPPGATGAKGGAATKPGPASASGTKPGPASATKPGPSSATRPGPASSTKPGPASATKPGPASAMKKREPEPAKKAPEPPPKKKPPPITGPEFHPAVVKPKPSSSSGSSSRRPGGGGAGPVSSKSSKSSQKPRRPEQRRRERSESRSPSPVGYRGGGGGGGRYRIDSESEEDSEMDDFIDDSDDRVDVSAEIGKLFGYNRHKYRDEDEDDRSMEASYSSMMKEEARSAKIGKMEDLEDMRREEEEKKRKKMMQKKGGGKRGRY